jgi:uncharacterized protein
VSFSPRTWIVFAAIWCGLLALRAESAPVGALDVPKNDGWVTDLAGLISASDEVALEHELEEWKRGSGHEIAVLTVTSLGGNTIEGFANEVFRAWGLGSKDKSDAALLVVAKNDRKMRIEVGRGMEGVLPDILCGRIIRDVLTPAFKRGDFSRGIRTAVESMKAIVGGDSSSLPPERKPDLVGLVLSVMGVMFIFFLFIRAARRGAGGVGMPIGGRYGRYRGGGFGGFGGFGGSSGGSSGGGFSGFGGGGGSSGGGASGGW